MRKQVFSFLTVSAVCAAFGAPQVTVTNLDFNEANGFVTVDYSLTEPAVVTVDFHAKVDDNWQSLGEENFQSLSGDVNRRVTPADGQPNRLSWAAFGDGYGGRLAAGDFRAVLKAWPLASPPPYMVIDLVAKKTVRYYASTNALPGGVMNPRYRTMALLMRRIPAANREFRMGLPIGEWGATYGGLRESPHLVCLTKDFYMAVFPFTQGQCHCLSWNGSFFKSADDWPMRPRDSLKYGDLRGSPSDSEPINWPNTGDEVVGGILQTFRDFTGVQLDLPLDAQYEFACRAGTTSQLYYGEKTAEHATNILYQISWTRGNSGNETHVVGQLIPNAFGLYDMVGNVRCRCRDWYVEDLRTLGDAAYLDPKGPSSGTHRVSRGTTYAEEVTPARTSYRAPDSADSGSYGLGTRFVCPANAAQ